jgi:aspartate kinase
MEIYKFGGASVRDAASLDNVANIVQTKDNLWIVVSAIGKTTNALEILVKSWFNNLPDKINQFNSVRNFHIDYIDEVFGANSTDIKLKIDQYFDEVLALINKKACENYDMAYDMIVSYGELFSTLIFSEYLKLKGIQNTFCDARDIIITDANNRDAKILWNESAESFAKHNFSSTGKYVIQGFIGRSVDGTVTTLGREGSDYTASALAYLLNAESVSIWKDVPGIMNADPAWCDFAQKLDVLSYLEAIELAFFGAKVIHPKTIKPIENKNIPLYVKSFVNPTDLGTVIKKLDYKLKLIPVYILKENQTLISISPKDFSFIVEENMSKIFGLFAKYKAKVNITQNSAVSFSASIDGDNRNFDTLIHDLQSEFFVKYNSGLELITIRYYDDEAIAKMISGKKVLMEQRSRSTARFLVAEL